MTLQHFSVPIGKTFYLPWAVVVVFINFLCAAAIIGPGLHQKHCASRLDSLINKDLARKRWAFKFDSSVAASVLLFLYCFIFLINIWRFIDNVEPLKQGKRKILQKRQPQKLTMTKHMNIRERESSRPNF